MSLYKSIITGNDSYLNRIHNIFDFAVTMQVFFTRIQRKLLIFLICIAKTFKGTAKIFPTIAFIYMYAYAYEMLIICNKL